MVAGAVVAAGAVGPVGPVGEQAGRGADGDSAALDGGGDPDAGGRGEAVGGGEGEAAGAGGVDDRPGERVLAGVLGGGGQDQQAVLGEAGAGQRAGVGDLRGALGERAGLVEGGGVDLPEAFHHDGGLDQHAVPAGVGDGGEQRRHGGQHDGAGRGDDHEGHGPQQ